MVKYELIKEYPGSPDLGWISNNNWKGYPEFWEEVVEKDYEILSFISKEWCIAQLSYFICENNFTGNDVWKIYSVKRISDSEIFTIGDKIEIRNLNSKIDSFYIKNECLMITSELSNCGDYLKNIKKVKQPLFTTEDGVDIFENDSYYVATKEFYISQHVKANYGSGTSLTAKYFSTKEKAEEYILLNKPCLSYGDIQEFLKIKDCNKVLELVEQKLNK